MKSTYKLVGLEEQHELSDIVVSLHTIEGIQLVAYNGIDEELVLEYNDSLVDKIIVEVMNLIRSISPKASLKNI